MKRVHSPAGSPAPPSARLGVFVLSVVLLMVGRVHAEDAPGSVVGWGINNNSNVGPGAAELTTYIQIPGLEGVSQISAGGSHNLALKADGSVLAWGWNGGGQIGDGTQETRPLPVSVPGLSGVLTVAAGHMHSLAVTTDGRVFAWGANFSGESGQPIGEPPVIMTPLQIPKLDNVLAVSGGNAFSLALRADGSVWAWGRNTAGQLGKGSFEIEDRDGNSKAFPVAAPVAGLPKITAIAAGMEHALALDGDGAVWTWGSDEHGQCGATAAGLPSAHRLKKNVAGVIVPVTHEKKEVLRTKPAKVAGLPKIKAIATGQKMSLALTEQGTVFVWGEPVPRKMDQMEIAQLTQLKKQGQPPDAPPPVIPQEELDRVSLTGAWSPVQIPGISGAIAAGAGQGAAFVLTSTGQVLGWGENNYGDLGNGTKEKALVPGPVKGLAGATAITVGPNHALALFSGSDSFWKWYPLFSARTAERMAEYMAARLQGCLIGHNIANLRDRKNKLLAALTVALGQPGGDSNKKAEQFIAPRIGKMNDEIMAQRKLLEAQQHLAEKAVTDLREELKRVKKLSGDAHPVVGNSLEYYQDIFDQIPLEFAQAEGDPDSVRWATNFGKEMPYSAATRHKEALALWNQAFPTEALTRMRMAAKKDPNDKGIQDDLAKMEVVFLRTAIEKSQGAVKAARAAFNQYLGESGFAKQSATGEFDGKVKENSKLSQHWYSVLTNPGEMDSETAWAIVSTGIVRSLSAVVSNKPEDEARTLEATEGPLVKAFKGLHVMVRLREKGLSLKQIKNMSTADIQKTLPLKDAHGQDYNEAQFRLIGQYIHEAMLLKDVQALVAGDEARDSTADGALESSEAKLATAMSEGYWNPNDTGDTWAEWIGDLTSPMNLAMLLTPMSIARTGGKMAQVGKWGSWSRRGQWTARSSMAAAGVAEAEIVYGTEVMATLAGWRLAARLIAPSAAGKWLAAGMQASIDYRNKGGLMWKLYWTGRTAVGGLIIQYWAIKTTKEKVGVPAAIVVEAMLLCMPDADFLVKFLKKIDAPVEQAVQTVVAVKAAAKEEVKQVAQTMMDIEQLRKAWKKAIENKTLTSEEMAFLIKTYGADFKQQAFAGKIITGDPELDAFLASKAVAEKVRANQKPDGPEEAVEKLEGAIKKKGEQAEELVKDTEKLEQELRRPPPPPDPPDALAKEEFLFRDGERPQFDVNPESNYGRAEAALREGRLDDAENLFEEAWQIFADADRATEMLIITHRKALVTELKALKAAGHTPHTRPADPSRAGDDILPSDLDAVWKAKDDWKLLSNQGATSETYDAAGEFIVKKITTTDDRAILLRIAEGEAVGSDMAKLLGMDAPSVAMLEKNGEIFMVFRKIEGHTIGAPRSSGGLGDVEVHVYREELSEHRMLSYVLGDYDRHTGNYMVSADGKRVFGIDMAGADVRGANSVNQALGLAHPEVTTGVFGRDHLLINRANALGKSSGTVNVELDLMAELSVSYSPRAQAKVAEIVKHVNEPGQETLRKLFTKSLGGVYGPNHPQLGALVNEALQTTTTRARQLESVMKDLNKRNLGTPR